MSKPGNSIFQLFKVSVSLFVIGILFLNSCRNEKIYRIVKIQTDEVVNITDTSAVVFGIIVDIGEGISEYGFCWNSVGAPTIDDSIQLNTNADQTGRFTGIVSGLKGGETYYINTYANDGKTIIYGEEKIFSCIEGLPKISTGEITNIGKASMNAKGIITSDGGNTILAKGFVWSNTENPVFGRIDGSTNEPGKDTTFTSDIANLVPNEEVYIRAYATNEKGTGYGKVKKISTLPPESGDYIWANYYGSFNHEESNGICTDAMGNIFVTGRFKEYTTLGDQTLKAKGEYDVFIAKIDNEGEVIWAKSAGGIADDNSYDICSDNSGNVYITGSFSNSITFGTTTLNSSGQDDFFLAKYDNSGKVLWATKAGGTGSDKGKAVSADSNGNVFITGSTYSASITFGAYVLNTFDVFTVKYNSAGTVLWAREIDKTDSHAICVDNSGNVYISGKITIGALPGGAIFSHVFVTKYNNSGILQWTDQADGAARDDQPTGICYDNSGNIYISGHSGSITFLGQPALITGSYDVFIAKYNSSGTVLWSKSAKGTQNDYSGGISIDALNNLYISGSFLSDKLVFGNDTLFNSAYTDLFFAKYDSDGDVLSVKSSKGPVDDFGGDLCTFSNYVYLSGHSNSRFLGLDYFAIENKGRNDLIIAKIIQ